MLGLRWYLLLVVGCRRLRLLLEGGGCRGGGCLAGGEVLKSDPSRVRGLGLSGCKSRCGWAGLRGACGGTRLAAQGCILCLHHHMLSTQNTTKEGSMKNATRHSKGVIKARATHPHGNVESWTTGSTQHQESQCMAASQCNRWLSQASGNHVELKLCAVGGCTSLRKLAQHSVG